MKISQKSAFISGLKSTNLSNKEILFLKKYKPWGIILFSRNIKTIKQTQNLTSSIKKIFKNNNYPILIDEEGGRVSRLKKFIDSSIFTSSYFANLYKLNKKKFNIYYDVYVKQISYLLKLLGVNINTVPVLDIKRKNQHSIIGDRAYSNKIKLISILGDITINKFHANRVATVIKHIPGHGLSKVDSHLKLPVINKNYTYLKNNDFFTFKKKKALIAMTGHLLFKKIDPINLVTHSKKLIKIIRSYIGFKGLIITDDLSMKAIKLQLETSVRKTFEAGCNIALHCNGNIKEMEIVAKNSPRINKFIIKKTSELMSIIS